MNNHHIYKSSLEGAKGLLGEVAMILQNTVIDFVIIGGWVPFLFNSIPIPHPGTFDVDVLLPDNISGTELNIVIEVFLEQGYLRPVKNRFQLFRILKVNEEEFVYHVDFLHRKYSAQGWELCLDFELASNETKMSIPTPGTDLVFTMNERLRRDVSFVLPNAENLSLKISFATEVGMLSAKGRSMNVDKRVRDAFDIFLIIFQSDNYKKLVKKSNKSLENGIFRKSLCLIFYSIYKGEGIKNIMRVLSILEKQSNINVPNEQEVRNVFNIFFNDIGWQGKLKFYNELSSPKKTSWKDYFYKRVWRLT